MRPQEIVAFEVIQIGALVLGLAQFALTWESLTHKAPAALVIGVTGIVTLIILGLTLLISRGRSNKAKWILVVFFVLGLPGFFNTVSHGLVLSAVAIPFLEAVGQLMALLFLFTAPARDWLGTKSYR